SMVKTATRMKRAIAVSCGARFAFGLRPPARAAAAEGCGCATALLRLAKARGSSPFRSVITSYTGIRALRGLRRRRHGDNLVVLMNGGARARADRGARSVAQSPAR